MIGDGETELGDNEACCSLFSSLSRFSLSDATSSPPRITRSVYTEANRKPGLYPCTAAQHNGIERHNAAQVKQSAEAFKLLPIPLTNLMERL